MRRSAPVIFLVTVQAFCAVVFVSDIVISVLGLRTTPIEWQTREFIEIGAAVGLILGTVAGLVAIRRSEARARQAEDSLRIASGAFHDLIEGRFEDWQLTPAERDVALFSLKGLSLGEIATVRGTSEGTVKAQAAAIYRKAGVSGRAALLGLFVESLMDDTLLPEGEPDRQDPVAANG
ncbi:helix-turn-helix transcriptional regulator [Jannaschia aquimarina]|uniref:Bacterial regulatory protein, luxR family n=1 Tax=Jannaschia aquimarina TaxID=935700 RepID=A0A0D1EEY6_9RHOB|nr:LuxR C-terminal-related transcriptional regulator [Jannaschia aquimarina]KIT14460.1 Bacterial regulatory protein, luxR family [Jannaschia aquimarina]SNT29067.1 regulatory protein, luxR family [Jannaschia aquimarina]